jgi:hypothetical protein
MNEFSLPSFSRSPIGGKKTSECKCRIADETKFALAQKAHSLGMTESELTELFLCMGLFGKDHLRSVMEQRLDMVGASFPSTVISDETLLAVRDAGRARH